MARIALLVTLVMLAGCGTTGKDIKTDVSITISNNTGSITIAPDLATESGDNSATPNNSPKVDVPINVPVDVTNPLQKLENAIESATGAEIEAAADEIIGVPVVTSESAVVSDSVITDGADQLIYTMQYRPEHDRMFTWLEQTGADFGEHVILSVPECDYELVVNDPQNNFKADGLYFDGTHNGKEANGIRASFFAPQGCRGAKLIVRY